MFTSFHERFRAFCLTVLAFSCCAWFGSIAFAQEVKPPIILQVEEEKPSGEVQPAETDGAEVAEEVKEGATEEDDFVEPQTAQVDESLKLHIAELIDQLGDDEYLVRESAQAELIKIGISAYDQLVPATDHEDLEVASRARYIVRALQISWTNDADPPIVRELMNDYATRDFSERLQTIELLSSLPDGQGLPVLCRLLRYENSPMIAQAASSAILWMRPVMTTNKINRKWYRAMWIRQIQQNLPEHERQAVQNVLGYAEYAGGHDGGYEDFKSQVDKTLAEFNKNRKQQIQAVQERGLSADQDPHLMLSQIDNILMIRPLLYMLAEAQVERGEDAEAKKTLETAAKLAIDGPWTEARIVTGYHLEDRGLVDWAIDELKAGYPSLDLGRKLIVSSMMSEMYHDQHRDKEAAESLQQILDDLKKQKENMPGGLSEELFADEENRINGRKYYFEACEQLRAENIDGYKESIDKALEADPAELDALIARYHLPEVIADLPEDYIKETTKLLEKATEDLKKEQNTSGNSASACNQLAWLAGNTDGDFKDALAAAMRANQLSPDSSAYLDTLAHVYAGNGQYELAIREQQKAVALEPSSMLLADALKQFEEKLAAEKEAEQQEAEKQEEQKQEAEPPEAVGTDKPVEKSADAIESPEKETLIKVETEEKKLDPMAVKNASEPAVTEEAVE